MITTVTENNQVIIPSEIAQKFAIHPGTQLKWEVVNGSIIVKLLRNRHELARELLGAGRRWLKPNVDPISDLIRERDEDDRLDQADWPSN